jgi:hypothetical protein
MGFRWFAIMTILLFSLILISGATNIYGAFSRGQQFSTLNLVLAPVCLLFILLLLFATSTPVKPVITARKDINGLTVRVMNNSSILAANSDPTLYIYVQGKRVQDGDKGGNFSGVPGESGSTVYVENRTFWKYSTSDQVTAQ